MAGLGGAEAPTRAAAATGAEAAVAADPETNRPRFPKSTN
ncbi:hypothetical protein RGUI_1209 [Rhodovulum sp. P5]|nr:hypothetical protein RGUI_1209 [Rhodovulum sp. P5]